MDIMQEINEILKNGFSYNEKNPKVYYENNVMEKIKEIPGIGTKNIIVACDENTKPIAENLNVCSIINGTLITALGSGLLLVDEAAAEKFDNLVPLDTGFMISIGSGSITDLVRYTSYKRGIPFASIPTAPSVDGYTSSVAPITVNGIKKTFEVDSPYAIYCKPDIISGAPSRLVRAGFGDMYGKLSAGMDWMLAHHMENEVFRKDIFSVIKKIICELKNNNQDNNYYNELLMKGLCVSGLAITEVGNSRPASGSEHHISHFMEMVYLRGFDNKYLHGETVGMGTYLTAKIYNFIAESDENEFIDEIRKGKQIDRTLKIEKWFFGKASPEAIKSYKDDMSKFMTLDEKIENFRKGRNIIKENIAEFIPKIEEAEKDLKTGCPMAFSIMNGMPRELLRDVLLCAKEVRNRYTILKFLDQCGLLEFVVEKII